jgi:hypothetical protein
MIEREVWHWDWVVLGLFLNDYFWFFTEALSLEDDDSVLDEGLRSHFCFWKWLRSVSGQEPLMAWSIGAVPPTQVLVVPVGSSPYGKALLTIVSNVLVFSRPERDSLISLSFPSSDDCSLSDCISRALLVGDNVVSLSCGSDGSGSLVEDEPLLLVVWLVVSDSKTELATTNALTPENGFEATHLCLDLEGYSISIGLFWIFDSCLIEVPGMS